MERIANSLKSNEDRELFLKLLNDCQKHALAINAKENHFQQNLDIYRLPNCK
jgi:hypothetical protein